MVFGQTKVNLGLQASPNFAFIKSDIVDAENKTGIKFNYGLMADILFTENYMLSTGIGHGYDGGKLTAPIKDENGADTTAFEMNYSAQFVRVPLLLKMRTKEIGYMRYFAVFGITAGIKVNEKVEVTDYQDVVDEEVNYINPLKASLSVGLGAEYSLGGNTRLLGGIIFNNNFTNMLNKDNSLLVKNNSSNTFSNIALQIGVLF